MKDSGDPSVIPSANSVAPSERTVLDWAREAGEADGVIAELDAFLRRRRRQRVSLAAGGLAVFVLAVILQLAWRAPLVTSPEEGAPTANVVIVRPESRTLADGSVVDLNAGAEIDVDFAGVWRRVTLRKGEAHFRVAKDAQRPFVVRVGTVEVRAVGTAFSVELGRQAIEVLVTEGVVVLNRPAHDSTLQSSATPTAAASVPTFVAGKMIVLPFALPGNAAPAQQVTTLSKTDIEQHLAWRVPRLEFAGTPLAQALPMFNQHGRARLSLADPALGQLQLSGVLRADDTETLLRLLEGEFGLIAESSGGEILIRRRP